MTGFRVESRLSAMSVTTITSHGSLSIEHLGIVDYQQTWEKQRLLHHEIAENKRSATLLLLEHFSVYTAGRRTLPHERPFDGTPVIDVDRGGKITWHGPGQLVGYPIVKLKQANDVVGFVREIETALIDVCREFGIDAVRYCERSGVWLRDDKGDRKIAAIGIRVARGVTMHGFALNVNPDLSWFDRIVPCGIPDVATTSLAKELDRDIAISEVAPIVERHISQALAKVSQ